MDKDKFIDYYINENHTQVETAEHFNISRKKVNSLIKEFNCNKDKKIAAKHRKQRSHDSYVSGGQKSSLTQKHSWVNKSQEEKDKWSNLCREAQNKIDKSKQLEKVEKSRNTYNLKSIDEKNFINLKRSNSLKEYWNNLSKNDHIDILNSRLHKTRETCLDKYGLEFPCMRKEARLHGNNSKPNRDFEEFLISNNLNYEREFSLGSYTYDFKVKDVLIEINPSYTHSVTINPFNHKKSIDKFYHYNKTMYAKNNGYRCINIWDWDDITKVIFLLKNEKFIYARKCVIKDVQKMDAIDFINKYHLQNYALDSIRIGLYYNNELVSIMTFGKPRYNKKYEYELIRYCSSVKVIGGAEKLFSYFKKMYLPKSIISYCDYSKFNGNVYNRLGFTFDKCQTSKHWYNIKTKKHIIDSLLRQQGFDRLFKTTYGKGSSNKELMLANGFIEVYDAGQASYTYFYK